MKLDGRKDIRSIKSAGSILHSELKAHTFKVFLIKTIDTCIPSYKAKWASQTSETISKLIKVLSRKLKARANTFFKARNSCNSWHIKLWSSQIINRLSSLICSMEIAPARIPDWVALSRLHNDLMKFEDSPNLTIRSHNNNLPPKFK